MKRVFGAVILAVFFALALSACAKPKSDAVAKVNGKEIDRKLYDIAFKERTSVHKTQNVAPDTAKLKDAVLQELIAEALIIEEAPKMNIIVSEDDINKEMEAVKKNHGEDVFQKTLQEKGLSLDEFKKLTKNKIILVKFRQGLVKEDAVTEEEMKTFYEKSGVPFLRPETVFMKMIEFSDEGEARKAAEDFKTGRISFDGLADRLDKEKKAVVSDYGWVSPDFFSPSMAKAVKGLKLNQVGGPYKGMKSFFLIRVKDRKEEGIKSFDEVKGEIRAMLLDQKRQAAMAHWIAEKRKSADIKTFIN